MRPAWGPEALGLRVGRPLCRAAKPLIPGYPRAYVAHLRVGSPLPELPLFILPDRCVSLPLETTYAAAYGSLAREFREMLEAP